jgi:hypothetical protein
MASSGCDADRNAQKPQKRSRKPRGFATAYRRRTGFAASEAPAAFLIDR